MKLDGRHVVVTGASRGIGAATARALGRRGAAVSLLARTRSDLAAVAADVEDAGGTAGAFPVDLAEAGAAAEVAGRIGERAGEVDGLVCSAGVGDWTAVPETTPADAARMMDVTYGSAFELVRAFLPGMLDRDEGRVALVTSPAAYFPIPGATAYVASRWAVRGFAEALRADLTTTGVGVTLVVPGLVETGYFEANDNVRERLPATPRSVEPDRVGEAVARGMAAGREYVVEPPETWLPILGSRLSPRLLRWYAARRGWQPGGDG